ncbi:MAG: hypothetical protein RLZZ232_2763 [Planctomycetota bacterium]|jgi:outer membrane protein TolC
MICNRNPAFGLLLICTVIVTGCHRTRMVARQSADRKVYAPEIPAASLLPGHLPDSPQFPVAGTPHSEKQSAGSQSSESSGRAAVSGKAIVEDSLASADADKQSGQSPRSSNSAVAGGDSGKQVVSVGASLTREVSADSESPAREVRLTGFDGATNVPAPSDAATDGPAESAAQPKTEPVASAVEVSALLVSSVENTGAQQEKPQDPVTLESVVNSVYRSYPLLQSAVMTRQIAIGQQTGASGAFDTKVKGASENGPLGFYETYRQSLGLVKPTYWGGEVFGGYRVGRGDYQPWYQERQTNDGGEFKAGIQVPLARNREIDDRRAELWKAGLERQLAEPDIQAQLIDYVQAGSYAYWDWVAAGEYHRIATRILTLAEERTARIDSQVREGFADPPELTDNLRLVSIRQAKAADTRRKLEQTAAKLSVYLRDSEGQPVIPDESGLPGFPELPGADEFQLDSDIQQALLQRPELKMLDLLRRQVQVDYSNARNLMQPELNAVLVGSQDVGGATSSKRDKSELEAEASLYLDVPVERRKARGKMTETQAKLAQLAAKRRLTADKIAVDVRVASAALNSAREQVAETAEALKLAEELAERERQNQEAGASDLLKVTLREQYAVESAEKNIDALKLYFESVADYRAALAQDQLNR